MNSVNRTVGENTLRIFITPVKKFAPKCQFSINENWGLSGVLTGDSGRSFSPVCKCQNEHLFFLKYKFIYLRKPACFLQLCCVLINMDKNESVY